MANGDLAAAQGWTTFPNTQEHSEGHDNDNYVLDRVAEEKVARVAADALKLDASRIQIADTENPAWPNGTIWLRPLT